MEHLEFVFDLVRKNNWFCSLNLADAYFAAGIDPSHWKYLKFMWDGVLWEYRVMVFGLAQAPYISTKLCKSILAMLRSRHLMRCSLYLHDMILIGTSKLEARSNATLVCQLLQSLGFHINPREISNNPHPIYSTPRF